MMISTNRLRKNLDRAFKKIEKSNIDVSAALEEMLIEKSFGVEPSQELIDKFVMMQNAYMDDLEELNKHSMAFIERLEKEIDDENNKNGK